MRILHVTPWPLPDIRVERAILSDISNDFEVHLAAPAVNGFDIPATKLDGFHELRFSLLDKAGIRVSRKRLKEIVKRVRPDVIHAHDFPAARLAKGLAPLVYDSHEDRLSTAYVRAQAKLEKTLGRLSRLLSFVPRRFKKVNREAIEGVVVVAPSKYIVERYLEVGAKKGFELPNFPHRLEVPQIRLAISKEPLHGAVDRPKYLANPRRFPRRYTINGFPERLSSGKYGKLLFAGGKLDVPNVISLGFVRHIKLYELMKEIRTLLVPWRPHETHRALSPNRVYTLIQVGAVPVVPHTMEQVLTYVPEAIKFFDDMEFWNVLENISSREPDERFKEKQRVYERAKSIRRLDERQKEAYKRA